MRSLTESENRCPETDSSKTLACWFVPTKLASIQWSQVMFVFQEFVNTANGFEFRRVTLEKLRHRFWFLVG